MNGDEPLSPEHLEGQVLEGRFHVLRRFADGGMAVVYVARDRQLDEEVIVKVPKTFLLADDAFRAFFEREIDGLVALRHPHVVSILARGEERGVPYMVQQFLRGGNLRDRLKQADEGRQTAQEVRGWLSGVASALDFVHAQDTLHLDVKPENILFHEDGHVALADFGIARALRATTTLGNQGGAGIGTPAYMPPEQVVEGAHLEGTADQYALGATVYEALTGRLPLSSGTPLYVHQQKRTSQPPEVEHPSRITKTLKERAGSAVVKAVSWEPRNRFESCSAFKDAFREGLGPSPRARVLLRASLVATIAILLGALVWVLSWERGGGTTEETQEKINALRAFKDHIRELSGEPKSTLRLWSLGDEEQASLAQAWTADYEQKVLTHQVTQRVEEAVTRFDQALGRKNLTAAEAAALEAPDEDERKRVRELAERVDADGRQRLAKRTCELTSQSIVQLEAILRMLRRIHEEADQEVNLPAPFDAQARSALQEWKAGIPRLDLAETELAKAEVAARAAVDGGKCCESAKEVRKQTKMLEAELREAREVASASREVLATILQDARTETLRLLKEARDELTDLAQEPTDVRDAWDPEDRSGLEVIQAWRERLDEASRDVVEQARVVASELNGAHGDDAGIPEVIARAEEARRNLADVTWTAQTKSKTTRGELRRRASQIVHKRLEDLREDLATLKRYHQEAHGKLWTSRAVDTLTNEILAAWQTFMSEEVLRSTIVKRAEALENTAPQHPSAKVCLDLLVKLHVLEPDLDTLVGTAKKESEKAKRELDAKFCQYAADPVEALKKILASIQVARRAPEKRRIATPDLGTSGVEELSRWQAEVDRLAPLERLQELGTVEERATALIDKNLCDEASDLLQREQESANGILGRLVAANGRFSGRINNRTFGTRLFEAVNRRDLAQIKSVIRQPNWDFREATNEEGRTALHVAARNLDAEVVKVLLDAGAYRQQRDPDGARPFDDALRKARLGNAPLPLHETVKKAGLEQTAEVLIRLSENVDVQDAKGATPLHYAAKRGHEGLVRVLVEVGARTDLPDGNERTPLHALARMPISSVADAVSARLVEPLSKNRRVLEMRALRSGGGMTPLHLAVRTERRRMIEALLQRRTPIDVQNGLGQTPLHLAAAYGSVNMINLLLDRKADLYAHVPGGKTPLHQAVEQRQEASVRALVRYARGKRLMNYVNVGTTDNVTPLHIAAYHLDESMIRLLLDSGASPRIPNSAGQTPIDMVEEANRQTLVDLMEKYK